MVTIKWLLVENQAAISEKVFVFSNLKIYRAASTKYDLQLSRKAKKALFSCQYFPLTLMILYKFNNITIRILISIVAFSYFEPLISDMQIYALKILLIFLIYKALNIIKNFNLINSFFRTNINDIPIVG